MARKKSDLNISRRLFACVLAVAAMGVLSIPSLAQMTITGRFTGTVMDTTGATLPGATVTVLNLGTGLSRTVTTDARGFYVVTDLPVGNYSLSAERRSFGKETRSGYHIDPDARVTVDFTLKPGTVTETVEVTGTGETVNTTSGEISHVIDAQQVQSLPLNGRNYDELVTLMPGVAVTDEDEMAITTSLTASPFSVNGVRSDQNLHTLDGGFNLDSGSNGSLINNVGLDFVQEVSVKSSNFSAEYGRAAGAAINVVTKSGSNGFHGGISEYFRNDALDANNYFVPKTPSGTPIKAPLRFNNPAWQLGGPIKHDKLFFFVGEQWKFVRTSATPVQVTMPTAAELSGDFRDWNYPTKLATLKVPAGAPAGCALINGGKTFTPQCITPDGKAIASLYTAMEQLSATGIPASASGSNTTYQNATPFDSREDFARIDYQLAQNQTMYLRYIHDNFDITLPNGFSCASNLPSCAEDRSRPGTSYQLAHTWSISPMLVNAAKINASWNGQRLIPLGNAWQRSTYGFTFPFVFPNGGGRFKNAIPDISISNFETEKSQTHALLSPTTDIAPSDDLTWSHGQHTIKTGAVVIRNRKDQNSRSLYAGSLSFTGSATGNALADALMGDFNQYQEASDDPIGLFRWTQYQAYVDDTWKVARNLSLEMGVRYGYYTPWYAQGNNLTNFDPSLYNPAQAVTVTLAGKVDPSKGGNPFNGLIRAGSGVPDDQLVRIPNGQSPAVLAVPAGAPRGFYSGQSTWAPRVGFALQPFNDDKTSVRGGFGIFYDTPEGNMIFDEASNPPFATTATFNNGSLLNPSGGASAAAGLTTLNGAIDPHLKQAYTMNYSLSVQRELPSNVFLEVAYVGDQARHLMRKPDINMPSIATMLANAALPAAQRATALDALRPYRGYSSIGMFLSDAIANYNALQVYATKRKGDLLATVSYTYSKNLTDSGGGAEDVRNSGSSDNIEDATMRFLNYGASGFDHRHIFVSTFNYRLPFFRSESGFLDEAFGGWEIGGLTQAQSGGPYTVTANSPFAGLSLPSSSRRRAEYLGGPIQIDSPGAGQWFNTTAFAAASGTALGTSGAGNVRGPGLYKWDFSLRKEFGVTERVKLQFRGDMVNAFNHTNYRFSTTSADLANNTNISSGDYGHPTAAGPPRQIQLGMRLTF